MRNIGLPSRLKKILHNYNVGSVYMDEASYFGNGLARRHRPPSPDIYQTHVRLHRLGLAKNSLAPDLPRCTAARSTGVALRLSFDLKAGEFAALRENLKPNFDQFVI